MAKPAPPTLQDFGDKPLAGWRLRLYTVIFEADTRAGRLFDKALIVQHRRGDGRQRDESSR
jgi:voltage-gated potassium channel